MTAEPAGRMHTHRTPDVALWDQYRALREQWTHEDMPVSYTHLTLPTNREV